MESLLTTSAQVAKIWAVHLQKQTSLPPASLIKTQRPCMVSSIELDLVKCMSKTIKISGAGCCLVDQIHPGIDFSSSSIERYKSCTPGDGGLHPGRLVFKEQFEAFANQELNAAIRDISQEGTTPVFNIGGPSVVSLIHAAQLLQGIKAEVSFHGARGEDKVGQFLQSKLEQTPVKLNQFKVTEGSTPSTIVLSDPGYNNNQGERIFINDIGAAWNFGPQELSNDFFDSDIVVFGGTALVPGLHHHLTELLERSKAKGCITVVNTVYDFQSELEHPGQVWGLGKSSESYRHIDLLIMDSEEALKLSGTEDLKDAATFFVEQGVSSFIITRGTDPTICYSDGRLFAAVPWENYPVSSELIKELKDFRGGDTTGCGDNFVGGVLASLAWQLNDNRKVLDLQESISWGTVSGGYCCYHMGGTYFEKQPGEKLALIRPYYEFYKEQINADPAIIIFGAGKIGRSFIGQLFGKAAYKIVFVDMDESLVHELNSRGSYPVIIKSPGGEERVVIDNVIAIHAMDRDAIIQAISNASIMTISVGKAALPAVAVTVAAGLLKREEKQAGQRIDIILAENMRSVDHFFREKLREILPVSYPLNEQVGLVETSIGKMVPIMTSRDLEADPLQVFAEPYNTLILDKKGFKGVIPLIKEFALKENMKAWVDRKAFIHNLGHATAAYIGYLHYPEVIYLYEVLADSKIYAFTLRVMEQSAKILRKVYPDEFTSSNLSLHIKDLLTRFQNRNLGDTIYRVGCDLHRKLGKDDRFMGIIRLAGKKDLPCNMILEALSMGLLFKAGDEQGKLYPGDKLFHEKWSQDRELVLQEVCSLHQERDKALIKQINENLSKFASKNRRLLK
jgi:mannitol-1-phosphate/altronate dehydrogenase